MIDSTKGGGGLSPDRLPPHSIECEQGVLGCIMLSPNDKMPEAVAKFGGNPKAMYDLRHQAILQAMFEMYEKRENIDVITLQQHLKDGGLLEQVGGLVYLATLPDTVPSAANFNYYADIVSQKLALRLMIQTCQTAISSVYEFTGEVDELIDGFERDAMGIRREYSIEESSADILRVIQSLETSEYAVRFMGGEPEGLKTGFNNLDAILSQVRKQELVVIAARPSVGKTALGVNIMDRIVFGQNEPVGIFSFEMASDELIHRWVCMRAKVDTIKYAQGSEEDVSANQARMVQAMAEIAGKRNLIKIDDKGGATVQTVVAKARRMVQQFGVKAIMVDYLQLIRGGKKFSSLREEVTFVSGEMKLMARELGIPVFLISQLSRDVEKRAKEDKPMRPRLSDLRETGAIEQDANIVLLLHCEDEYENDVIKVGVNIAKRRNGATGMAYLNFYKRFTRFEDAARVSDEDAPS